MQQGWLPPPAQELCIEILPSARAIIARITVAADRSSLSLSFSNIYILKIKIEWRKFSSGKTGFAWGHSGARSPTCCYRLLTCTAQREVLLIHPRRTWGQGGQICLHGDRSCPSSWCLAHLQGPRAPAGLQAPCLAPPRSPAPMAAASPRLRGSQTTVREIISNCILLNSVVN